jgi:hypothetical protein
MHPPNRAISHPLRALARSARVSAWARAAILLLALVPLVACASGAALVDVQVVDTDQGGALWPTRFQGRDYIAGAPGHRFTVTLQNRTGERVLAVLSVDGINAISGQTAGASQAGYVLEPWQRVDVRGWRKSYSDVAEFYFTDLPDSYGARTGRPENVGVIGVAAFRERRPPPVADVAPAPVYPPYASVQPPGGAYADRVGAAQGGAAKAQGNAAPAAAPADAMARAESRRDGVAAEREAQQLGTGHGERRYDPVAQTQFERATSRPEQRSALYYDAYEALAARGVFGPRRYASGPDPFPVGFVPDPD